MNPIRRFWTALGNLAAGIERLAWLANSAADIAESRLELATHPTGVPELTHAEVSNGNGRKPARAGK